VQVDALLLKSHRTLFKTCLLDVIVALMEFDDRLINFIAFNLVEGGDVVVEPVSAA